MGWLTGWNYRKSKSINGSAAGNQSDYQLVDLILHYGSGTDDDLNVYLNGHCNNDFSDIRFTTSDGITSLKYWIKEKTDGDNCEVVVKVVSIPTGGTSIYIYYGNSGASSESTGTDTFLFFDDFALVWERQGNCLPSTSAEPSVIYEGNPQILTGESQVFKMWYRHGWSLPRDIYYAESTDGLNWTQYGSNPVISNLVCTIVLKHDSTYYIFGCPPDNSSEKRYHSSNGITWIDDGIILNRGSAGEWDSDSLANCNVWIEGENNWKMLYEAKGSSGYWKIGLGTSPDGLTWTKSGSNPVISETGARGGPNCHKIGSYYYLWVHGSPSGWLPTDIYRYRSLDLTSWSTYPAVSVFPRVTVDEGQWTNDGQVADPFLLEHDSKVYMWYCASTDGAQEAGSYHAKLAIADMTLAQLVETDENSLDEDKWDTIVDFPASITKANGYLKISCVFGGGYQGAALWTKNTFTRGEFAVDFRWKREDASPYSSMGVHLKHLTLAQRDTTYYYQLKSRTVTIDLRCAAPYIAKAFTLDSTPSSWGGDATQIGSLLQTGLDISVWYDISFKIYTNRYLRMDVDGVEKIAGYASEADWNDLGSSLKVEMGNGGYQVVQNRYYDDFRVRKYVDPEPQWSTTGGEEGAAVPAGSSMASKLRAAGLL